MRLSKIPLYFQIILKHCIYTMLPSHDCHEPTLILIFTSRSILTYTLQFPKMAIPHSLDLLPPRWTFSRLCSSTTRRRAPSRSSTCTHRGRWANAVLPVCSATQMLFDQPTRIVVNGYPQLEGETLLEMRRCAREKHDDIRQRCVSLGFYTTRIRCSVG